MSLSEILALVQYKTRQLDDIEGVSRRYETIMTIFELLKLSARIGKPMLPVKVDVEGELRVIKTREQFIDFINNIESILLKARDELEEEALEGVLTRAKLIALQLAYLDVFEVDELRRVNYAPGQNKLTKHHRGVSNETR